MRMLVGALFILVCACGCGSAGAQVYKCVGTGGATAFQDQPCARGQRQSLIDIPSRAPPGYVPAPAATVPPADSAAALLPAPAYVPPPAPLPVMYACVGAVNGDRYLTRSIPPPYLAPLGVMGYPPLSLAQAYGPSHHVGTTDMGAAKPPVGGPSIAAGMTEVQDRCRPAAHAEVCSFVRNEYDANHRRLRMAMRREQPPLEQRERELTEQLRNC